MLTKGRKEEDAEKENDKAGARRTAKNESGKP